MSGLLKPPSYPFSAVFGMESVKRALLCAIVNPRIKGIVIKGNSGTGKTVLARSLAGITGKELVNVPLNVTDEQLFGCLDIEAAINEGVIRLQEGLMNRADGNILYLDDVNLLDQRMLSAVVDSVLSGEVKVERENLSTSYMCRTTLIGTMNINDSYLSPRTWDCFDICVNAEFPGSESDRIEVMKRNLEFNDDPDAFLEKYAVDEKKLISDIVLAKELFPKVKLTDDLAYMIADICSRMDITGLRGDLSVMNTALAIAALAGRDHVIKGDVEEASVMCLAHRRKEKKKVHHSEDKKEDYEIMGCGESAFHYITHDDREDVPLDTLLPQDEVSEAPVQEGEVKRLHPEVDEVVSKIGETFHAIDLFEKEVVKARGSAEDRGKRDFMKSSTRAGRYVGSRITDDKNPDLAFDATVRAAAPYQVKRHGSKENEDIAVIIEKQDLREKVREVRSSSMFLFAVDTSGSLIIRNRMMAVKAAILSLLKEHYVKKDRVGFMTFNEEAITMLLPPTKSVECIYKLLDDLPVGKRTPLSAALVYLSDYMTLYTRKHKEDKCYVVIVTDGNANICLDPEDETTDAVEEALEIAGKTYVPGVKWIVIDSEKSYVMTHNARKLAEAMHAGYYTLEDLRAEDDD